ncbi:hypothetical protein EPI10_004468 [Gossypium australe]|uniref:Uncharacterized protein n=1 Tax=Gossypium australe TaxID=47621 RepID=A0A5B6WLB4_9ROSI|nr:hypothetical protein EPI10_004468 [Gossypium australe]
MEATSTAKALRWNQAKLHFTMPRTVGVVEYGVEQVAISIKPVTERVKQATVVRPLIVQALVVSQLP